MRIPIWQVDAFTERVFAGNPAAVCTLERWLPDETLRAVAAENALSETAFLVREGGEGGEYAIRWFTPEVEVDLCGHATLASGFVVLSVLEPARAAVTFRSQSGLLGVSRGEGGRLVMTFPRRAPAPVEPPPLLVGALGRRPLETLRARDLVAVLDSEDAVRAAAPDLAAVAGLDALGLAITAPGSRGADFVSRYFAPQAGVPEDPVTGSAHCTLAPYWAARLGKRRLLAHQVSRRGGVVECEDTGEAVVLAGRAALYLTGELTLPDAGSR
ncbi:PhzF family phenazine biosynthesis protein [Anaeromyxobacter sp. Fw109-5]|uniref:PhzF family phenazine biosynthesis protein n=1 Tax=Anaeromyxobacter sp. (strain Fw109-5) TaxID=404589 RepID=UPI0000ED780D|nr:PhzF family phenazine biosynthesis protein [Anaeromyxobacter sp. Fw109-5]ABS24829.1 phenazine biosynthesis protein PhzF family [Anaeromyxobacter sp. Fw109-5]